MTITFFFRPEAIGAHSIENVFEPVIKEVSATGAVRIYRCTNRWKRFHSFLTARFFQSDINHITGDVHELALFLNSRKTILTIHDVGRYERDLSGLRKIIKKLMWLSIPARRAIFITTISNFTKNKLVSICGIPESKIRVIPNFAPEDFVRADKIFCERKPTILQIGSGLNKNINRLIDAIDPENFRLLLVRSFDDNIVTLLKSRGIEYEWYTNLSREEIIECYKKCDIVYFASEYEGFGLPILEANKIGRVVLTSNLASMPEVAGNSAVLVDPFDVDAIRSGLNKIKKDRELREELIQNGFLNAEKFSLSKVADMYRELYHAVLNEN